MLCIRYIIGRIRLDQAISENNRDLGWRRYHGGDAMVGSKSVSSAVRWSPAGLNRPAHSNRLFSGALGQVNRIPVADGSPNLILPGEMIERLSGRGPSSVQRLLHLSGSAPKPWTDVLLVVLQSIPPRSLADNLLLHWLQAKYWYENNNDPTALTRLSEAVVWVWLTRDDARRGVCPERAIVTQLWCFDYHLLTFSHQCMIISSLAVQLRHIWF